MSPPTRHHEAHDYAERLRKRLPRHLQELRDAVDFTKHGLARESGVSRYCISNPGDTPASRTF